jgi:tRNA threonylcarbamoyladenosine biosynthesis protein TsaE
MKYNTNTVNETYEFGQKLGGLIPEGRVISLSGDIGAGKTVLIKGIASSIGINPDEVISPYFNILFEYKDKNNNTLLYHFDFMRLSKIDELYDLNIIEIVESDAIVTIEWGDKFDELIPDNALYIKIEDITPYTRAIHLDCNDKELYDKIIINID